MDLRNIITTNDYMKFNSYLVHMNNYLSHCLNNNSIDNALLKLKCEKNHLNNLISICKLDTNKSMVKLVNEYLTETYKFIKKEYM